MSQAAEEHERVNRLFEVWCEQYAINGLSESELWEEFVEHVELVVRLLTR